MAGTTSVAGIVTDAGRILNVWSANPEFAMGTVTKDALSSAAQDLQAAHTAVESKRTELTGLMDARDDKAKQLQELISRARSGIRAAFGPDAAQYEQAGCTRKSDRKSHRRTANGNGSTTLSVK